MLIAQFNNSIYIFLFTRSLFSDSESDIVYQMAVLRSCFGCCSLRSGCILIGLFAVFVQICALLMKEFSPVMLIGISLALLLNAGALWRNHICLWIWIVGNFFMNVWICVGLILSVLETSVKMKAHDPEKKFRRIDLKTTYFVFVVVLMIAVITTFILFTFVVYSYICELREKREGKNSKGNSTAPPPEANRLVPISEFSVRFEKKIDEMFNSKWFLL